MKSKKEQGNAFFKKQKYKQAVECYNEYVKAGHPDNSKAYSNIALCYFKIAEYANCVKACQMAVQLQPQFEKPFYRMYQAYRQLKDYYGMMIAASKFCRVTKDQKDIQAVQKELIKVKEDLSYNYCKTNASTDEDRIISQILSLVDEDKNHQKAVKQPQTSLHSKWQKIEQKIKTNRHQGLNLARRFLNVQCKSTDEKEKYAQLLSNAKKSITSIPDHTQQKNKQQSDSSYEQPTIEELQKYSQSIEKKNIQSKQEECVKKAQTQQKKDQNSQIKLNENKIGNTEQNSNNKQIESSQNQTPLQTQPQIVTKWQQFVSESEAERLLQLHINSKLSKADDPFLKLYELVCNVARSTQLDKFQKEAILSIAPTKINKFSMLIKSYTLKQKQELGKLFTEFIGVKVWKNLI